MDTHELAWAAGFFDGEGYIGVSRRKPPRTVPSLQLAIGQVRMEPLERFRQAVGGLGRAKPYKYPQNRSPIILYQTGKFEHIQAIIAMLWPWLSEPKREQAARALREVKRARQEIRGDY